VLELRHGPEALVRRHSARARGAAASLLELLRENHQAAQLLRLGEIDVA
jgi:hypothetical protein